jgi:hypothetical protein
MKPLFILTGWALSSGLSGLIRLKNALEFYREVEEVKKVEEGRLKASFFLLFRLSGYFFFNSL